MNWKEIEREIVIHKNNPNVSRGCVGILTKNILSLYKNYFDQTYFSTPSVRACVWCVRNDHRNNKCSCGKELEWKGTKYSKFCSKSCASKNPHKRILSSNLHRIKTFYVCYKCNEFNSHTKNRMCKTCGYSIRNEKMKILYSDPKYIEKLSKINSDKMTPEARKKLSLIMKNKILNGEFTPKSNNRRNHERLSFDGHNFRSSWEKSFYIHMKNMNINLEYETLRIPYTFDGNTRIYIVDFIDPINRVAFEVKPSSMIDQVVLAKENALIEWCRINNYLYRMITEKFICSI